MLTQNSELSYKDLPALNLGCEVKDLCQPLFSAINANYFDYCRVYNDNSFMTLSSDAKWLEHFFKEKYVLGAALKHDGMHMWDSYYYQESIHNAKLYFNYSNGISIFRKQNDYIEYFDIAGPLENRQITSMYFNQYDLIDKFVDKFKEEASALILHAESKKIKIPNKILRNDINPFNQNELYFDASLSQKESIILYNFILGKTATEIAIIVNRSVRTIEKHIENIKIKLHCKYQSKSKLIETAIKIGLVDFIPSDYFIRQLSQ